MSSAPRHGWCNKKLNDLGFVGRGKSKHRPRNDPSLYDGAYPFIQTGEIKDANLYISNYCQTYNEKGLAQSKLWKPDTLCITIAANIAETAILKIPACFPDSIVGFTADPEKADVRYVKYFIDTLKLRMQNISRGTTQDNLSLEKLLSFDLLVPDDVQTQRRIAAVLSAYDDLIENNARRVAILEEMARNLYREWFVHFRSPGHEDVEIVERDEVRVPEGWEVTPLQDFGEIITGKTSSKQVPEYFGHDMPFIKIPDMHENMFCLDAEEGLSELGAISQRNKTIPQNSLCVSCIGTAGLVAITTKKSQTNQQINSIVLNNFYLREFLYFALLDLKETIMRYSANGATMVNLNKGKFEALQIIRPQDAIFLTRYGYHTNRCQGGADGRHLDYSCFCRD